MPSKNSRVVQSEILDHLAATDPAAQRSRRDLKRINWLMGNESRIVRAITDHPIAAEKGIVEIGAGDGTLISRLARNFPTAPVSAYDLAARPQMLAKRIDWHQGDLFDATTAITGGVLVANLFLHHFEAPELSRLGQICEAFDLLIFNEPDRARLPHALGLLGWPFINHVTRHDMHVSIHAGFQFGELAPLLALTPSRWQIRETSSWRGARFVVGCRV